MEIARFRPARGIALRSVRLGTVVALTGFLTLVAPAGAASAASGGVTSTDLSYAADNGEANQVTVSRVGADFVLIDTGTTGTGPVTITLADSSASCALAQTVHPDDTLICPAAGVTTITILTGAGADSALIDSSVTGPSSVTLDGGFGDDQLENDSSVPTTFIGDEGTDVMVGRSGGNDTVSYADAPSSGVSVNLRTGTTANDGEFGTDTFTNMRNVIGSSFSDLIEGDAGANTLIGGGGADVVSYSGALSGVTVDLRAGTATGDGTDTLSSFEGVIGSNHDDTFVGIPGDDSIDGGPGTDTIDYSGATGPLTVDLGAGTATGDGTDTVSGVENLIGSPFGDALTGSSADNVLNGAGGDDTLNGVTGDDTLIGGTGSDTATFAGGAAVDANLATGAATGQGTDSFSGIENLTGSSNADRLTGNAGNNVLDGGTGNDILAGGLGQDTLIGGGGEDTADYTNASIGVTVDLSTGTATGEGTDALSGITDVNGSGLADQITGDAGDNTLNGGGGDDVITGGLGSDTVLAGLGNDTILIRDGAVDTAVCGPGTDSVTADPADVVGADCEQVDTGQPTATTTTLVSSSNPSTIGQPVTVTATVSPTDGGGTVAFLADGSSIPVTGCDAVPLTLSGGSYRASCALGTGLPVGNHPVQATYTGDTRYLGGSGSLTGGQQVDLLPQTITFPALGNRSIVDLPFPIQGVSGGASGNPVTFTASGATCTVSAATVTLTRTGKCTITAHQAGTSTYAAAPVVARSFTVLGRPSLTITDVNTPEGNTGTHPLAFRVLLNRAVTVPVTVHWATAHGSATAPGDFTSGSGTVTFAPGQTVQTLSVAIKGDRVKEPNEVFFVLLSNPQNATIADANAAGGILNDD